MASMFMDPTPSGPRTPQRPSPRVAVSAPKKNLASVMLKKARLIGGASASDDVAMRDDTGNRVGRGRQRRTTTGAARQEVASRIITAKKDTVKRTTQVGTSNTTAPRPTPKLKELVSSRFDASSDTLDLTGVASDVEFKAAVSPRPLAIGTIVEALRELQLPVKTLILASNNIGDRDLRNIVRHIPDVVEVSLANNQIKKFNQSLLGGTSTLRKPFIWTKLTNLILSGNPIVEILCQNGLANYHNVLGSLFPSLEVLDGHPLPTVSLPSRISAKHQPLWPKNGEPMKFPTDVKGNWLEPSSQAFAINFLTSFLQTFDSQREMLPALYTPTSTFSYACVVEYPFSQNKDWKAWDELFNRNLMSNGYALKNQHRATHHFIGEAPEGVHPTTGAPIPAQYYESDDPAQSLWTGASDIGVALSILPRTQHLMNDDRMRVDAFPLNIPGVAAETLMVSLHGDFIEDPDGTKLMKTYDRTMILAIAPPGSAAAQIGSPAIVISDQLTIRAHTTQTPFINGLLPDAAPHTGQKGNELRQTPQVPAPSLPGAMGASPAIPPAPFAVPPPQIQQETGQAGSSFDPRLYVAHDPQYNQLPENQRQLVLQLMGLTKLSVLYSIMCLQANNWDVALAQVNCDQIRLQGTLPPDAFLK